MERLLNEPETSHYVYKFVLNDEIIYIGKSDVKSFKRIESHFFPSDNIEIAAQDELKKSDIWYACLYNEIMSDVVESELIRRHRPKYNKAKTKSKWKGMFFPEPIWIPYKLQSFRTEDEKYIKHLEHQISILEQSLEKEKRITSERTITQCFKCMDDIESKYIDFYTRDNFCIDLSEIKTAKSYKEIIDEYRQNKHVDYISLAYDIYGNIVCQKKIFVDRFGLEFIGDQTGTNSIKCTLYSFPDQETMRNWNIFRLWINRGSNRYYKMSNTIKQALLKGEMLCLTK